MEGSYFMLFREYVNKDRPQNQNPYINYSEPTYPPPSLHFWVDDVRFPPTTTLC